MRVSNPLLRRQPLSSLATKIVVGVFLSTFLTALVVSWTSVHSTYGFLRGELDRSFPSLLTRTSHQILSRLGEGRSELERLAADPALPRTLSGTGPAGDGEELLNEALHRTATFDTLLLVDSSGETVAIATTGGPPPPPVLLLGLAAKDGVVAMRAIPDADGTATPVGSIPVVSGRGQILGALCGVFHRAGLRRILTSDGIGANGEIYLVDGSGQIQFPSAEAGSERGTLTAELLEDARGKVRQYRSHSGERVVGATLPLGALGWTLVVEQPLAEAFQPLLSVMKRLLLIDLCVILLFGFVALQVTATVVHPIEALSEGARRISQGELDLEIPDTKGSDEIGLLIRTFNDMTRKLLHHRTEIQQVNRQLLAQNDQLQRANEILEQLSITDGLTKLHNHRFFQEHLTREIKRVDRSGEPLSLLLLDIDDFKQLNDHFGHVAGDELLVGLAQVLHQSMRDSDLVARYGGEEFAVLATNTDLRGAANLGEKVRTAVVEAAFIVGDSMRPTRMTISIGVAQYRGSRKQLFRRADRALYRAKAEGKDCVVTEELESADAGSDALARET
jgi:diguanylate cyclase (GGDEF)-like protein